MNHGRAERASCAVDEVRSPPPSAEPVGVPTILAEAMAAFADPAEQKRRLVARIQAVVADPLLNVSIVRAAADLVVFHDVPPGDIEKILVDIEAMRQANSLRRAGAFFLFKMRKLTGQLGKPWPNPKADGEAPEAGDWP